MKFSDKDITNLKIILETCAIGGINSIIIEDGVIRGVNESRNFAIISAVNVPKLPQKMGISNLAALKQRLELFNELTPALEAKESDRGEISAIDISAGRNKAQFRCTSTSLIKAPKTINDEISALVKIDKSELKIILGSLKMTDADHAQLVIDKNFSVSIKLNNTNSFECGLESKAIAAGDNELEPCVHSYDPDMLQSVLRNRGDVELLIGVAGTIRTIINEHVVVIMPRYVGDD